MPMNVSKFGKLTRHRDNVLLTMCIPALLKLLVFSYLPMIGIWLAFVDYSPRLGLSSEFVGLKNFEYFFKSGDAMRIIGTTIGTNFVFIIVGLIASLGLALLMNEVKNKTFLKVVQGVSFVPYFLSWLVVGYLFSTFLNAHGVIAKLFGKILNKQDFSFYTTSDYWLTILTVSNIWKNAGVTAVIYLASIIGIDKEYYEAAELDGATGWQKVFYITLPFLVPMICVMTLINIGNIVRSDFGLFFFVTKNSGTVMSKYEVIDTYVYKLTVESNASDAVQRSAAAGLLQSITGMVLVTASNYIVKKINSDSALF